MSEFGKQAFERYTDIIMTMQKLMYIERKKKIVFSNYHAILKCNQKGPQIFFPLLLRWG